MSIAQNVTGDCTVSCTIAVRGGWSAAEGQWEDDGVWNDVLAIRWNGSSDAEIGNPQSRGCATWFIVPDELENAIRAAIASLPTRTGAAVS